LHPVAEARVDALMEKHKVIEMMLIFGIFCPSNLVGERKFKHILSTL